MTATLTQERVGIRGHRAHVAENGFVEYRFALVKSWDVEQGFLHEINSFIRNAICFIGRYSGAVLCTGQPGKGGKPLAFQNFEQDFTA